MISIRNLTLRVPGRTLITNLNLEISKGQRWCVIGKNGSGKSTLLKTISGIRKLQDQSTGDIYWNQQALSDISELELARLRAYAEQFPQADPQWRVEAIVESGAWPWKRVREASSVSYHEDLKRLVDQAMQRCDIHSLKGQHWKYLSGGERQRVALAACLVQSTTVLVLDEPTAHLDLGHQFSLMDDLVQASESCEQIIVASVHDLQLAQKSFTHALLLNGDAEGTWLAGQVAEVLQPECIERSLGHPVAWASTASGRRVLIPQ